MRVARWIPLAALLVAVIVVGGLLSRALLAPSARVPLPASVVALTLRERHVLAGINNERVSRGLRALLSDPLLVLVARRHSQWMLDHSYFWHDQPPYSFSHRMHLWVGDRARFAENIAWGTGNYGTAVYLVREWMASTYHRQNILTPSLRRVGVGIIVGTFDGNQGATMATTDFST